MMNFEKDKKILTSQQDPKKATLPPAIINKPNFREWTPMTNLLDKIPSKAQKGFMTFDLKITSIAVLDEFLALGSNCGIVYWYNRKEDTLQKLKIDKNKLSPITSLGLIATTDYMLAAGSSDGYVTIFQIPKYIEDCQFSNQVQDENKNLQNNVTFNQTQRFDINGFHKSTITALEWSKNGMKLFSGDATGNVVLTEIDYDLNLAKSSLLLEENNNIVQLSYSHFRLLISSNLRTIIYSLDDKQTYKIGSQERKILGPFGAVFQSGVWNKNHKIFCARPGLRVWQSNLVGTVERTIMFKDLFAFHPVPIIPVINPYLKNKSNYAELQLGALHNFMNGRYIVTSHKDIFYIIDLINLEVAGVCSELKSIINISVFGNEIFILENERSIIRISDEAPKYSPNSFTFNLNTSEPKKISIPIPDIMTTSITDILSHQSFNFLSKKIKETSNNLNSNAFLHAFKTAFDVEEDILDGIPAPDIDSNIPSFDNNKTNTNNIISTITTIESHSLSEKNKENDIAIEKPVKPAEVIITEPEHEDKFQDIALQSFEEVLLIKPKNIKKKKKFAHISSSSDNQSDSMSLSSFSTNSEDLDNTNNNKGSSSGIRKLSLDKLNSSSTNFSPLLFLNEEMRTTSSIKPTDLSAVQSFYEQTKEDLEAKEKFLAMKLNWSELLPDSEFKVALLKKKDDDINQNNMKHETELELPNKLRNAVDFESLETIKNLTLEHERKENIIDLSSQENNILPCASLDNHEEESFNQLFLPTSLETNLFSNEDIETNKFIDKISSKNLNFGPPSGSSFENESLLQNITKYEEELCTSGEDSSQNQNHKDKIPLQLNKIEQKTVTLDEEDSDWEFINIY